MKMPKGISPCDAFEIYSPVFNMLGREKSLKVGELRKEASSILTLSPLEFLMRGIDVHSIKDLELLGCMARKGWQSLIYVEGKPGWRVQAGSLEKYVSVKDVQEMLGLSGEATKLDKSCGICGYNLIDCMCEQVRAKEICGIRAAGGMVGYSACDLEWGHNGDQHANKGDGFYSAKTLEEHQRRQRVRKA